VTTNVTPHPRGPAEVAWFSALCDDDYEFLGVPDPALRSSWEHCSDIVKRAEANGFDNVLLPSGYELGIDANAFAGAIATQTSAIKLLLAIRTGELWPPQLVRQLATIDRMAKGRLAVNIISSDLPGQAMSGADRYRRSTEVITIVKTLLSGQPLDFHGEFYDLKLPPLAAQTTSGRPPALYFGGLSEEARECAAADVDVYLMWPDTMANVKAIVDDMNARATKHGRSLRMGYRVHVVVRETEAEARAAADRLLSKLDASVGEAIRNKSLDTQSVGVRRQAEMRDAAASNGGYVEENLFTGIARARSGCGAAIVGDPDQVLAKLLAYRELGIDAFVLSGYPHLAECDLFAKHVLPRLDHAQLTV
jgi:alkanesulfonate monooxygenase